MKKAKSKSPARSWFDSLRVRLSGMVRRTPKGRPA
jgi:hypothetical protein